MAKTGKKGFVFDNLIATAEQQLESSEEKEKETVTYIKKNLTILEEFKFLIPPLTPDEFYKLELSILAEGCRDPLVVWDKDVEEEEWILIDGHNRYQICQKHSLQYQVLRLKFDDAESVANWIVNNQLGKRNATDETKSYLRGLQYNREKRKEANWQNLRQFANVEQPESMGSTSDRLGELHKVSEKTIKRDEKYAIAVDKICGNDRNLKAQILQKQIPLPKGKLEKLADEPAEKLEELGELLMRGYNFTQACKKIYGEAQEEIINYEEYSKQKMLHGIKTNIIKSLDTALKTKDKAHIKSLREYLEELENNL